MIILLVSIVVAAYIVADGSTVWSVALSAPIAFIPCMAYNSALDVQLFSLAWLALYISVQLLLPLADNRTWFAGWQIGRLRLAVAIV